MRRQRRHRYAAEHRADPVRRHHRQPPGGGGGTTWRAERRRPGAGGGISALTGADFVVTSTTANSATAAIGTVISQNPAAGTLRPFGSSVNVVVAVGALVPNVVGLTQAAAGTALTGAGLTVGSITAGQQRDCRGHRAQPGSAGWNEPGAGHRHRVDGLARSAQRDRAQRRQPGAGGGRRPPSRTPV